MYRLISKPVLWYLDHATRRWRPSMVGVLAYIGPRSGRQIRLVVLPMRVGDNWIVAVSNNGRKTWWKAFRSPLDAVLTVGNEPIRARGVLLEGDERVVWRETYLAQFPRSAVRLPTDVPMVLFRSESP
jgi:hypothetical protein